MSGAWRMMTMVEAAVAVAGQDTSGALYGRVEERRGNRSAHVHDII